MDKNEIKSLNAVTCSWDNNSKQFINATGCWTFHIYFAKLYLKTGTLLTLYSKVYTSLYVQFQDY